MGKASRRKLERRLLGGVDLPRNLPSSLRRHLVRAPRDSERCKISEALADLVRPFASDDTTIEDFRGLVGIGAIAWNLSLLKDRTPADALELLKDVEISDREWFERFVAELISRKQRLFPDDKRFVAGWEVALKPDGSFFLTASGVGGE